MDNDIILQRLKKYFPMPVDLRKSEDYLQTSEGKSYDFIVRGTMEHAGRCELNQWGRLVHFEVMLGLVLSSTVLSEDKLVDISWNFVRQFYPDVSGQYELSTVFNMQEIYSIYFEKKDERLGVTIPYVGFNVGISVDGQLIDFSFDYPNYKISYLEEMISSEEAKKIYVDNVELELAIEYCDLDTYINGDDDYHLLYKVKRNVVTVPGTGEVKLIEEREKYDYVSIERQETTLTSLYEALGISKDHHKLGQQAYKTGKMEVWSKLLQNNQFDFSMFLPEDQVIKIEYDSKGLVQHVLSGEETPRMMDKLSIDEARELALNFLFYMEPEAESKFLLRVNKEDPFEGEEYFDKFADGEDDQPFQLFPQQGYEEMYRFLFQRVKSDVFVSENFITIGIGKYSGSIRLYQNTVKNEASLESIDVKPVISEEQALKLYEQALRMELSLLPQFVGQLRVYSPGYLAKFAKEHQYVEAIDAVDGKLYEIDLNDPIPY